PGISTTFQGGGKKRAARMGRRLSVFTCIPPPDQPSTSAQTLRSFTKQDGHGCIMTSLRYFPKRMKAVQAFGVPAAAAKPHRALSPKAGLDGSICWFDLACLLGPT